MIAFISLLNNLPKIQYWSKFSKENLLLQRYRKQLIYWPEILLKLHLCHTGTTANTWIDHDWIFILFIYFLKDIWKLFIVSRLPYSRLRPFVGHLPSPSICKIYMDERSAASRLTCTVRIDSGKRSFLLCTAAGQRTNTFSKEVLTFSFRWYQGFMW